MERINVTKRVFRIGIFFNRGKSLRGQKKKKGKKQAISSAIQIVRVPSDRR